MTRKRIFEVIFGLYILGIMLFIPIAGIIHIGFLVYLSIKKEWQLILIALSIFILGLLVGMILLYNGIDRYGTVFLLVRIFFIALNVSWFIYALKKINYDKK